MSGSCSSHGYSEKNVEGAGLIMVDAVVVYRSEAFYGDVLVVEVALADPQPLGCDVLYRFTNKATGKEVARVKTGIAFFDYTRRRPVEMPEGFMRIAGPTETGPYESRVKAAGSQAHWANNGGMIDVEHELPHKPSPDCPGPAYHPVNLRPCSGSPHT